LVCVRWNDAEAFIKWLSTGLNRNFRLPIEAEFEYALKAGGTARPPWGNEIGTACTFANVADRTPISNNWLRRISSRALTATPSRPRLEASGKTRWGSAISLEMHGNGWRIAGMTPMQVK